MPGRPLKAGVARTAHPQALSVLTAVESPIWCRLKAAQIDLAVNFAEKSFAYRETSRNLALIEAALLPKARQSLEVVRAGYTAGNMNFASLITAERMLLDLQLAAVEARTQRAVALVDLTLMVAGVPPPDAPILPNQ